MITQVDKNLREVANGVSTDKTRETLSFIEIDKGCATVTDGHILVTTPVQDEDDTRERHYVKADVIKSSKDFGKGIPPSMVLNNGNIIIDDKNGHREVLNDWNGQEYPDTARVFPDPAGVTQEIILSVPALTKLLKCFNKEDCISFKITDDKTPIVVESYTKYGLIMPCRKPE